MATQTLHDLMRQAEALDVEEQLLLIAHLAQKARRSRRSATSRLWREIAGASPYPLVGEDAQTWVSRSRQEEDAC